MTKKISDVRVRFAPSPTGALHIGGVRTALYNYLFAKKYGGTFILRIEDTDSTRFVPGAEQYIKDAFDWLGLEFDEGPGIGGSFGPYKQSDKKDSYKKYADELVSMGLAYYAFDSKDDICVAKAKDKYFSYDANTRTSLKNSLTLSKEEVDKLLKESKEYVVRIKYPDQPINIKFDDVIRGNISINTSTLDDKVIWKRKDNLPTYHLANVVDDHFMEITHVIRGEEWIPSTPLHIYLYDSFGWDKPLFAHLPLILGPNGKLSKRDGDKYGFPVYPLEWVDPEDGTVSTGYKSMGYDPKAVINILAFLGWNPGTNKEVYSLDELIKDFDLSRVNKSGANFNQSKAAWFNGQHFKNLTTKDMLNSFIEELDKRNISLSMDKAVKIIEANKNKVNFIKDIFDVASYLFGKPTDFDAKGLKKWKPDSADMLAALKVDLEKVNNWIEKDIQEAFEAHVKSKNIKFGNIAPQLRLVLSGKANGPSLFGIMELIGKNESLDRLINTNVPSVEVKSMSGNNQEIEKLKKELDIVNNVLKGSEKKLSNPNFVNNAPKDVVEKETNKMEELTIRYDELLKQIEKLR